MNLARVDLGGSSCRNENGLPTTPRSSANWTRLPDELALRFNADAVVHGTSNALLAAEVNFG